MAAFLRNRKKSKVNLTDIEIEYNGQDSVTDVVSIATSNDHKSAHCFGILEEPQKQDLKKPNTKTASLTSNMNHVSPPNHVNIGQNTKDRETSNPYLVSPSLDKGTILLNENRERHMIEKKSETKSSSGSKTTYLTPTTGWKVFNVVGLPNDQSMLNDLVSTDKIKTKLKSLMKDKSKPESRHNSGDVVDQGMSAPANEYTGKLDVTDNDVKSVGNIKEIRLSQRNSSTDSNDHGERSRARGMTFHNIAQKDEDVFGNMEPFTVVASTSPRPRSRTEIFHTKVKTKSRGELNVKHCEGELQVECKKTRVVQVRDMLANVDEDQNDEGIQVVGNLQQIKITNKHEGNVYEAKRRRSTSDFWKMTPKLRRKGSTLLGKMHENGDLFVCDDNKHEKRIRSMTTSAANIPKITNEMYDPNGDLKMFTNDNADASNTGKFYADKKRKDSKLRM